MKAKILVKNKIIDHLDKKSQFFNDFRNDVLKGLSSPNKYIPCKYIYDEEGSRLFKAISNLPEYYLTRAELQIFKKNGDFFRNLFEKQNCNIIELGVGDGHKTKILIEHLYKRKIFFRYYPIDISSSSINEVINALNVDFKDIEVNGFIADFSCNLECLSNIKTGINLILFLGSNIGNMDYKQSIIFLKNIKKSLKIGDFLLIGFDLKKDPIILNRAYNDSRGLSEKFSKNLLNRINKELGGNFKNDFFSYSSVYDPQIGAVVTNLVSKQNHSVYINSINKVFSFKKGEKIHTESSYKYNQKDIEILAKKSGFRVIKNLFDDQNFFTDSLWQVREI